MDLSKISKLAFNGRRVCILKIDERRVPAVCQNTILVKTYDGKQYDVYESEGFQNKQLSIQTALVEERLVRNNSSLSDVISIEDISTCLSVIDVEGLANLDNLKDLYVLSVLNVNSRACLSCISLSNFVGIEIKNIGTKGFQDCISLSSMQFKQLENLDSNAFKNCELLALVQISSTVLPTTASDAFVGAGSKTASNATKIRVNDQLYKSYIIDTNWATMKDHISSFTLPIVSFLSGDTYDTLISKQTLNYGMSAIAPTITQKGYEFLGWRNSYNDVSTDVSCYAIWRKMPLVSYFNTTRSDVPGLSPLQLLSSEYLTYGTDARQDEVKNLCCTIPGWKFIDWLKSDGSVLPIASFKNVIDDLSAYAFLNKYVDLSVWQKTNSTLNIGHIISGEADDLLSGMSKTSSDIASLLPSIEGYTLSGWNPTDGTWNPINADTSISTLYMANSMSVDIYAKYLSDDTELILFILHQDVAYGQAAAHCDPIVLCASVLSDYVANSWLPYDPSTRPITKDLTATLSCDRFRTWVDIDIWKAIDDNVTYITLLRRESGTTLLSTEVSSTLGEIPDGYGLKEWKPPCNTTNGWLLNLSMSISAMLEALSGEVLFYECYPEY